MANYVEPFRRLISTDGTLTSAQTQVGDALYNEFTFALSFRAQDGAGAPVEVVVPSIGGGGGTSNRLAKFTAAGTIDDSQASDTGTVFSVGQAGQWRLVGGYGNGSGWQFYDNANNVIFDVGPTGKITAASDITMSAGVMRLTPLSAGTAGSLQVSAAGLVERATDATTTPYTAAIPGNWNGAAPTNVEAAIDRMAALLQVLNGGAPIP